MIYLFMLVPCAGVSGTSHERTMRKMLARTSAGIRCMKVVVCVVMFVDRVEGMDMIEVAMFIGRVWCRVSRSIRSRLEMSSAFCVGKLDLRMCRS